jgi:DtxR family transcriptional regulator, Mn-dependent transcriptional regulator
VKKKTIEEYIETIYALEKREGKVQTGMLAAEMGVKPPSITETLQKLEKEGLIQYESYAGAILTPSGKRMARELTMKHSILAEFLEIVGVDEELAEMDACQMEHHVSARTIAQLEKFVTFVQTTSQVSQLIEQFRSSSPPGDTKGGDSSDCG